MKQGGIQVAIMRDETFRLVLLNHEGHNVYPVLIIGTAMPVKSTFLNFFVEKPLQIPHKPANLRAKSQKNQSHFFRSKIIKKCIQRCLEASRTTRYIKLAIYDPLDVFEI